MAVSIKSLGIDRRRTEAQRSELDRRIADYEANPDDVVSWEEVKARIAERLQK